MNSPSSPSNPAGAKTATVGRRSGASPNSDGVLAPETKIEEGPAEADAEACCEVSSVSLGQAVEGMGVAPQGRVLVHGARKAAALIWGGQQPADFALTLSSDFETRGKGDFDLVILQGDVSNDGLGPIHDRLRWAASHVSASGRVVLSVGALAAPLVDQGKEAPVGPYDGLLFPESIAAGDAGARRARVTPLAASTWILLARSVGLSCIEQQGIGDAALPEDILLVHEQRLAVFDHHELRTAQMILILAKSGAVQ